MSRFSDLFAPQEQPAAPEPVKVEEVVQKKPVAETKTKANKKKFTLD